MLAAAAPLTTSARQLGTWSQPTRYDSGAAGPGGDHWYSAQLRSVPNADSAQLSATVTPTLPLLAGAVTVTTTGTTYVAGPHRLVVAADGQEVDASWSGAGNWRQAVTLSSPVQLNLRLRLRAGDGVDDIELQGLQWAAPARLDLRSHGAEFVGLPGTWRYQLSNVPGDAALYDVTAPLAPAVLAWSAAAGQFQDGPSARRYLVAGAADLMTPLIQAHQPTDLGPPLNATALYLAPRALLSALQPLLDRRQQGGYRAQAVAVEAIYDQWSFGAVSPVAIRQFLRYAQAAWQPAPLAVTLVGDGTADPRDYSGYGSPNLIPPFLANVDRWVGETACDICYAQLDGDSPTSDPWPDVLLGRIPVHSAAELTAYLAKLLDYETQPVASWQSQLLFLADNFRESNGGYDAAGDFAAFAEASAALPPAGTTINRVYYDPLPSVAPGHVADPTAAHARVLGQLNAGAAVTTYTGHANTAQLAVTDLAADDWYLLGYDDPAALSNSGRTGVLLEMTCLTSAFQLPEPEPSIDERLVLNPRGGMVAVWGPTGLGVTTGHDALQRGFFRALWAPGADRRIGDATQAGLRELLSTGLSGETETTWTYVLLGDPLMPVRVAQQRYLPLLRR